MLVNVRAAVFSAAFVMAVGFGAGGALAVPVHTSNTNVTSWDVGSGQVNGNFSVTSDQGFIGGPIELGCADARCAESFVRCDRRLNRSRS